MKKSELFLYSAYTSTCLEDRAWSFCISLCMQQLGGLRMISIEQFGEGIGQMIFSGHLGKIFDARSRKQAILTAVPLNNFSLSIAAGMFIGCLSVDEGSPWYTVLLICGMFMCAVNRLFLNVEKFIIGRDWVYVISQSDTLSNLNAILTSLDQLANVIAPILVGVMFSYLGLRKTCGIFGGMSMVSMISKTFFLRALYRRETALHHKNNTKQTDEKTIVEEEKEKLSIDKFSDKKNRCNPCGWTQSIFSVANIYFSQSIVAAAVCMAFLFMTVLGFDGLAVGYGQSAGLPESLLGGFRSFGSIMGIGGAMSYAFFERRLGVRKTGLLGLTCQQICAMAAVASIFIPGTQFDLKAYFDNFTFSMWWDDLKNSFNANQTTQTPIKIDWKHFESNGRSLDSIFVFLIAISTARFGLWMADLSITHLMQQNVAENVRNTVFGVHNALCQTFSVLKDVLVIILPDPSTFGLCILLSYLFMCLAYSFYIYYLIKHPEHELKKKEVQGSEEAKESISSSSIPPVIDPDEEFDPQ